VPLTLKGCPCRTGDVDRSLHDIFLPPARPLEFPRVLGRTRPARSALAPLGAGPARVSLWLALPPARARPGPLSLGPALSLSARPSLSLGPARPPLSWTRPLPARHGPARHDAPGPVSLHARSARPVEAQVRRARPGPPAPLCPSSLASFCTLTLFSFALVRLSALWHTLPLD
jgi:hypothetical protein